MKVAYVMSRFPKITETFVLYELLELERQGIAVEVFPLMREPETVCHPEAERLMPRVHFHPFLSAGVLAANLRRLWRQPRRYLATLAEVLWHTRTSANFFFGTAAIFAKTVRMAEDMDRLGVDHVHAHFANHPTTAALVIHRLSGRPYSFTAHGTDIHVDTTMFDRKLASARFAVTICRYNVEFLADRVGAWVRDRMNVVFCGTDTDGFAPPEDRPAEQPFAILCVASLRACKGHRILVEACGLLRRRGVDFVCRLIGDGELHGEIAAQIRAAGLEDRVLMLGAQPRGQVCAAMKAADVVALPSVTIPRGDREGIPVALMEGMASGRPVVSSRQAGIPELIDDGCEGILCPPGDAEALAGALQRLAEDAELRRRMGLAGRRKVQRDFDLRRNCRKLADLLRTSLRETGEPSLDRADHGAHETCDIRAPRSC